MNSNTVKAIKHLRIQLVKEIAKDLPSGFKSEIAKRAKVSNPTVTKFIKGMDNRKLYKVFMEYVTEYIEETKKSAEDLGVKTSE